MSGTPGYVGHGGVEAVNTTVTVTTLQCTLLGVFAR